MLPSINETLGLVSKWLRVTYTSVTKMIEKTESTEAAKESSTIHNGTTVSKEIWKLYFNVSRISLHFWTGCNEHVEVLDFDGLMTDLVGQHEQIGKLRKETTRSGKLLSEKKLYTDHMKKMWKRVMITIYFTKMLHKDTTIDPDKVHNSQTQASNVLDKIDELRERDMTTIIIYFTKGIYKDTTQDQAKVLNMQTQGRQRLKRDQTRSGG